MLLRAVFGRFAISAMVLALFFHGPVIAAGATTSGTLTDDETWSGTVNVTGDVTIPNGVTLTLEPGTQVFFAVSSDDTASGIDNSRTELIVQGNLIADTHRPGVPVVINLM